MSVTLNVGALKTRESTSDPWQSSVVKTDAVTDANNITYDSTETYDAGTVGDALNSQKNTLNNVENGLAIIVNGDTCSTAVPVGGYAYIKNNTHGLAEGLYTNTSASAFPTSGGTANSSVFTAVSGGGLNRLQNSIVELSDKFGTTDNAISNFDDGTFFENHFTTPNSMIILPFATVAINQPTTATWGFCMVYYGGDYHNFMMLYINRNGGMYIRGYSYGFGTWTQI